jgi:SHS2 domain-containing protein
VRLPSRRWGSFPTTADVGVWATGPNAAALLEALGLGLTALMTDLRRVRPREERSVRASAADPSGLVVAFLTELVLLHAEDGFVPRQIRARTTGTPPTSVEAVCLGEPFDPVRHRARTEVKAVTLHQLRFDPRTGHARVIVDI